jgi:hypothetical protein
MSTPWLSSKEAYLLPNGVTLLTDTNYWCDNIATPTEEHNIRMSLVTNAAPMTRRILLWSELSPYEVIGVSYANKEIEGRYFAYTGQIKNYYGDSVVFESYEYEATLPRYAVIWEQKVAASPALAILDFGINGIQLSFRQLTIHPCPSSIYFYTPGGEVTIGTHTTSATKDNNKHGGT